MIGMTVTIDGLDRLRSNFAKAPSIVFSELSKATAASIFTVEKYANDSYFQFKTPRSQRTGLLERSFAFGRRITGLRASIGPTVDYSTYVYFGTKRGIEPNRYMDRIAKAAEPEVQKHFENAVDNITKQIV